MSKTIANLYKRQQRVLKIKNAIKYQMDKEDTLLLSTAWNKVEMILIKINNQIKKEFNNQYRKQAA